MPTEGLAPTPHDPITALEQQQMGLSDRAAQTFWHRVRFELVARRAAQVGADEVLDVGAGSGLLGEYLFERNHRTPTVRAGGDAALGYRFAEASPTLDRQLTARFGEEARFRDGERVPSSTLCVLLDVIEHIEHDVDELSSWRNRMLPGAQVVITVPALAWGYSSWDRELGHHRRYSRSQLRDCLTTAGYDVSSCDYLFPEMLPVLVKRRMRRNGATDVDMRKPPEVIDRLGYAISSVSARLRRLWPAGTSVVAFAENPR